MRTLLTAFLLASLGAQAARAAEPDVCALVLPDLIKQTLGLEVKVRGPMSAPTGGASCVYRGMVNKNEIRVSILTHDNPKYYASAPGAKIVDGPNYRAYYTEPDQYAEAVAGTQKGTRSIYVTLRTREKYTGEQFQAFLKAVMDKLP